MIGGMLLLLAAFGLTLYALISRALINQFDAALLSTAQMLAASVEIDGNDVELEMEAQQIPELNDPERPMFYQIWRHDGQVVAKSPALGKNDLAHLECSPDEPAFEASRGRNGRPERSVALEFLPGIDDEAHSQPSRDRILSLVVTRDAGDLHAELSFLRWLLLLTSIAVIALSILIAAVVVQRGLVPLNTIAGEIGAITEEDLSARIGDADVPTEIVPIRDRLNTLLSRLEAAFDRERRFTADVAHELRTPLAGMRSAMEVTLARARDIPEYESALRDCLTIVGSMQTMVENLLMIARLEAGQVSFRAVRIVLAELVDSCWRPFAEDAENRQITFENRIQRGVAVNSDVENLSMVLSNVLGNAAEYTDHAGRIWVTGNRTNDCVEVAVANTGCSLTAEQVSQVFDCFWRGDPSRKDAGVHCGLGMALVQRIVKALGGAASVGVQPGGIFTVRLTLPDTMQRC
jgi:two-component system sensor histidine kinase QseC